MKAKLVKECLNEFMNETANKSNIFRSEFEKTFGSDPGFDDMSISDMANEGAFDDIDEVDAEWLTSNNNIQNFGTWNRWANEDLVNPYEFDDFGHGLDQMLNMKPVAPGIFFDKEKQVGKYLADEYANYYTWFFAL